MILLHSFLVWFFIPLGILFYYRKKNIIETTHILILALMLVALMRPVWHQKPQETQIQAQDIIIALDISYSMRAKDIKPSRYEYAKETIDILLKNNTTDNIMLIAFTSNPLLLSPPTTDHELISIALKSINMEYILTHGTSLHKLFNKLSTLKIENKHLLLITDGGEETNTQQLNKIIQNSNISLTLLALGTKQGTTIKQNNGSVLKNKEGDLIISRLNPMLKTLANENNALYITAKDSPSLTAQTIMKSIKKHQDNKQTITKMQQNFTELYFIPLFIALLLFITIHTRAIKYLIIFIGLFGINAQASFFDDMQLFKAYNAYKMQDFNSSEKYLENITNISLQSLMALGNTYYKQKKYHKALFTYQSIRSTSITIKQKLYYNSANCYMKLQKYNKAIDNYSKALQLGFDRDAHYNLLLAMQQQKNKKKNKGLSNPNAQSSNASSPNQETQSSETKKNKETSSGSGGGTQKSNKSKEETDKKLLESTPSLKQPMSSKVYELINKGYIYEKQPW